MNKIFLGLWVGVLAATLSLDAEAQRRMGGGRNIGRQTPQVQKTTPPQAPAQSPAQQQLAPATTPLNQAPQTGAAPVANTNAATARTATNTAASAAAARSPMRNMLLGAAAGLGLMALASWLGFGEGLATLLLFLLLGVGVLLLVSMFMRRRADRDDLNPHLERADRYGNKGALTHSGAASGAGSIAGNTETSGPATSANSRKIWGNSMPAPRTEPRTEPRWQSQSQESSPLQRSSVTAYGGVRPGSAMDHFMRSGAAASAGADPSQRQTPWGVPEGFDTQNFLAQARNYFGKLQAAWQSNDLEALSDFTTHDMFIALTHELRARAQAPQSIEVTKLEAQLLGIESDASEHLASVRFVGALRIDGEEEKVDEIWNLAKPIDGKTGWLLAGIQQMEI